MTLLAPFSAKPAAYKKIIHIFPPGMLHGEGRGAYTIAISRADLARFECLMWCADPTDQSHKPLLESPMKPELQQLIAVSHDEKHFVLFHSVQILFQNELTHGNVKDVSIEQASDTHAVEVITNKVIYRVSDRCWGTECQLTFKWPYNWEGTWNFQCNQPETALIPCGPYDDPHSKGKNSLQVFVP